MAIGPLAGLSNSMKLFNEEHAEKSVLRRGGVVTGFIEDISKSWTESDVISSRQIHVEHRRTEFYYRVVRSCYTG